VWRGVYTFSRTLNTKITVELSEAGKAIEERLRKGGTPFVVTGLDVLMGFVQHQPERILHIVYTAEGTTDWVQSNLRGEKLIPLIDPSKAEIENVLASSDNEVVIIRQRYSPIAVYENRATKERAFVDLYYETTRELIPFPLQEVAYIFENMRATSLINSVQMIRYAHERKLDSEIRSIWEFPKGKAVTKRQVRSFLAALRAIQ
jgi:hypothetical protein